MHYVQRTLGVTVPCSTIIINGGIVRVVVVALVT